MKFLDPAYLRRTYRDPMALGSLVVDLLPILAVLFLGWRAAPLVMLYWLENVIIGGFTLLRMLAIGVRKGPFVVGGAVFLGGFFTVHYGMFCFVHGMFLMSFLTGNFGDVGPTSLLSAAVGIDPYLPFFVATLILWGIVLFVFDFWFTGDVDRADLQKEMVAPYGRIIVLHIGIFAGAYALMAMGDPAIGVLALILLRAIWGIVLAVLRQRRRDKAQPA